MRAARVETHDGSLLGVLHAEHAAGGKGQIGLIERVEMKLVEAFGAQVARTCSARTAAAIELARFGIVVEAFVKPRQPVGHAGARIARPCARCL